jgi:hypothetical protein
LTSGEGILRFVETARVPATVALALLFALAGSAQKLAAGTFAIGKYGAYGQAYDYPAETTARATALKQCKGTFTAVTMKQACATVATIRLLFFIDND